MQFKHLGQSELTKKIAIWATSIGLLFSGFSLTHGESLIRIGLRHIRKTPKRMLWEEWSNLAKTVSSQRVV